jgi:metacaspase-1
MKSYKYKFLIICGLLYTQLQGQEMHALIFAVSHYEDPNWKSINANKDVPLLTEALRKRGFKDVNIHAYVDEPISAQQMLGLIHKHLVESTQENDVVFFHFSGHGQQIMDDNGDEIDGLDEALVPYDAPYKHLIINKDGSTIKYNYDKHLRDDDLGKALDEVRKKIGPGGNVLVSIDACHSGTSTRGFGLARGSYEPNVPPGWKNEKKETQYNSQGIYMGLINMDKSLAPMICFFGSQQHRLNYEYKQTNGEYCGSLSYALSYALSKSDRDQSYRGLFDEISRKMSLIAPNQTPISEGTLDQIILGGKLLPLPYHFKVKNLKNEKTVTIDGGKLQNLFPGTTLAFFKQDTRDTENTTPICEGTIINSQLGESEVLLDVENINVNLMDLESSWVFIRKIKFDKNKVRLFVESKNRSLHEWLGSQEISESIIQLEDNLETADLLIKTSETPNENTIVLSDPYGVILEQWQQDKLDSKYVFLKIKTRIEEFYRFKSLLNLANMAQERPTARMKISRNTNEIATSIDSENSRGLNDETNNLEYIPTLVFAVGDKVTLQIENLTDRHLYFALLDLTPDYKILLPYKDRIPDELIIPPRKSFSESFDLEPPAGKDILFLLASDKPIDIKKSLSSPTRGETVYEDPLRDILGLDNSLMSNTRGMKPKASSFSPIGISLLPYTIEER